MTVRQDGTGALIDDARQWHAIDWKRAQREVRRLQMRIAKAVKEAKPGKVKTLQWLVTHSFYAKLLAVKRVTSNIKRHVKIKALANPYMKKYAAYFWRRRSVKGSTWAVTWG
jgi:hypothetical protein